MASGASVTPGTPIKGARSGVAEGLNRKTINRGSLFEEKPLSCFRQLQKRGRAPCHAMGSCHALGRRIRAHRRCGARVSALILNWPTKLRSWVDISTNCCDASLSIGGPARRALRGSATPATLLMISPLPCAASLTLRDISFVVAFCSRPPWQSCPRYR